MSKDKSLTETMVDDLTTSFINGNRNAVINEIGKMQPRLSNYIAVGIYRSLIESEITGAADSFKHLLYCAE